ncbi:hypothetical protein BJ742DRAFT_834733 [Cladochytrium replicatum]|nr:hypothetical protein BJ742DRAFT_834733 [Cladochytrium replicatum]
MKHPGNVKRIVHVDGRGEQSWVKFTTTEGGEEKFWERLSLMDEEGRKLVDAYLRRSLLQEKQKHDRRSSETPGSSTRGRKSQWGNSPHEKSSERAQGRSEDPQKLFRAKGDAHEHKGHRNSIDRGRDPVRRNEEYGEIVEREKGETTRGQKYHDENRGSQDSKKRSGLDGNDSPSKRNKVDSSGSKDLSLSLVERSSTVSIVERSDHQDNKSVEASHVIVDRKSGNVLDLEIVQSPVPSEPETLSTAARRSTNYSTFTLAEPIVIIDLYQQEPEINLLAQLSCKQLLFYDMIKKPSPTDTLERFAARGKRSFAISHTMDFGVLLDLKKSMSTNVALEAWVSRTRDLWGIPGKLDEFASFLIERKRVGVIRFNEGIMALLPNENQFTVPLLGHSALRSNSFIIAYIDGKGIPSSVTWLDPSTTGSALIDWRSLTSLHWRAGSILTEAGVRMLAAKELHRTDPRREFFSEKKFKTFGLELSPLAKFVVEYARNYLGAHWNDQNASEPFDIMLVYIDAVAQLACINPIGLAKLKRLPISFICFSGFIHNGQSVDMFEIFGSGALIWVDCDTIMERHDDLPLMRAALQAKYGGKWKVCTDPRTIGELIHVGAADPSQSQRKRAQEICLKLFETTSHWLRVVNAEDEDFESMRSDLEWDEDRSTEDTDMQRGLLLSGWRRRKPTKTLFARKWWPGADGVKIDRPVRMRILTKAIRTHQILCRRFRHSIYISANVNRSDLVPQPWSHVYQKEGMTEEAKAVFKQYPGVYGIDYVTWDEFQILYPRA